MGVLYNQWGSKGEIDLALQEVYLRQVSHIIGLKISFNNMRITLEK